MKTFWNGGEVHLLEKEKMPAESKIAAFLSFQPKYFTEPAKPAGLVERSYTNGSTSLPVQSIEMHGQLETIASVCC